VVTGLRVVLGEVDRQNECKDDVDDVLLLYDDGRVQRIDHGQAPSVSGINEAVVGWPQVVCRGRVSTCRL